MLKELAKSDGFFDNDGVWNASGLAGIRQIVLFVGSLGKMPG